MSDDTSGLDAQKQQTGDSESANFDTSDISSLPIGWQNEIKRVRSEAAQRRRELAELKKKVDTDEQERLKEQGKWKELADAREAELNKVKPYQTRAEALEAKLNAINKSRLERIPEHFRSLIPQLSPEDLATWLDANEGILTKPTAPNLNQGAGGTGGASATPQLTDAQLAVAKAMGLSPEEYAKHIKK